MCVRACVRACVCVRERDRERGVERETETDGGGGGGGDTDRQRATDTHTVNDVADYGIHVQHMHQLPKIGHSLGTGNGNHVFSA